MNNNVVQAVSANGIGVLLLVTTLLNFYRKYRSRNAEQKVFAAMLFANLSQCIVEAAPFLLEGNLFTGSVTLSIVLNTSLYVNNIVYSVLWSVYAELRVSSSPNWLRIITKSLPGALVVLGTFVNLFVPIFFYVSHDNVYQRGPWFIYTYLISYAYLLMGTITAYRSRFSGDRYVSIPVITFLLPVVIASMLQLLFPGIALVWVGTAIGMNYAYISLVDEGASVDHLAGTFSRHQLNQTLETLPKMVADGHLIAGMMLDIDAFKAINDTYGHLVGDDAIRAVGSLLRQASKGYGKAFRYAGDEFTIIIPVQQGDEVYSVEERIHGAVETFNASGQLPCPLRLSIGHTLLKPNESIHEFILRMDQAMYQEKEKHKQESQQASTVPQ